MEEQKQRIYQNSAEKEFENWLSSVNFRRARHDRAKEILKPQLSAFGHAQQSFIEHKNKSLQGGLQTPQRLCIAIF
jgi:hypothetical protein